MFLLFGLYLHPVFAEVNSIHVDGDLFYVGDEIKIFGTAESGSTGVVTIVIRDYGGEFVLLTHSKINHDDAFEKTIMVENQFSKDGKYRATGFILNMTESETADFDILLGYQINSPDSYTGKHLENAMQDDFVHSEPDLDDFQNLLHVNDNAGGQSFIDPVNDPVYYMERYYSEPSYKSWFDRNYPDETIEGHVGFVENTNEQSLTANDMSNPAFVSPVQTLLSSSLSKSSGTNSNVQMQAGSEDNQVFTVIAALGIIFVIVYGIKRQADGNSRQITINLEMIMRRILKPIRGTNPVDVVKIRLARGEITIDEYELIMSKID